jgi:hypothetical protein
MCGWYPPAGVPTGNSVSAFIHAYNDSHTLGARKYHASWLAPQLSGYAFSRQGSPHAVARDSNLAVVFWLSAGGRIKHQHWFDSNWTTEPVADIGSDVFASEPVAVKGAVSTITVDVHVFAIKSDGSLWWTKLTE